MVLAFVGYQQLNATIALRYSRGEWKSVRIFAVYIEQKKLAEEKMTNPDIRLAADLHTLALPSEK